MDYIIDRTGIRVNLDFEDAVLFSGNLCTEDLLVRIERFIMPSWSEDRLALLYQKYPRSRHRSKSPASGLLRLPNEILFMIFQEIDSLLDVAYFCLTDGRLLEVGFSRVFELQKLAFPTWLGGRVICIGPHADIVGYPESLQEYIKESLESWPADDPDVNPHGLTTFDDFVHENFERCSGLTLLEHEYYAPNWFLSVEERKAISTLADPSYERPGQRWVLCNLSKNEYVRAEAIGAITDYASDGSEPFISGPVGLRHALLSRICWASYPTHPTLSQGELHRGPWAGDRFEVTTMDRLREDEWKDISVEVVEILTKIWDAQYPDVDWRAKSFRRDSYY